MRCGDFSQPCLLVLLWKLVSCFLLFLLLTFWEHGDVREEDEDMDKPNADRFFFLARA